MARFTLTKKISLGSELGEGHENDYLRFEPLTFKDATDLQTIANASGDSDKDRLAAAEQAQEFIKAKFVGGKITDEDSGNQIDVTKDDFADLPINIVNHCMRELSGAVNPDLTQA